MAGLNETPSGQRTHLAFFGRRNAGKSSLINALTNQQVSIVSDVAGTTTDPVSKAMEILPLGPCLVTDTPGLDDVGELGGLRVKRTREVLATTDIAILVTTPEYGIGEPENEILSETSTRNIPCIIVLNKSDTITDHVIANNEVTKQSACPCVNTSALTGDGIPSLKEAISKIIPQEAPRPLITDLIAKGDFIVCVCPIDESAPKGRLILPQQQVIREILDSGANAIVCRETELAETLSKLNEVKFVITDSQAFGIVNKITPKEIPLTSFSIVFARAKGDLQAYCDGVKALAALKDGDTVLISEGCTHHRQCNDIGTVKLPNWISKKTGKKLNFEWTSGNQFPEDLSKYSLVVHCGACMLTRRAVQMRIAKCKAAGIPITNYGICIAACSNIMANPASCMVER